VLSLTASAPAQIVLLPTGAGDARQLTHDKVYHSFARWLPNGKGFIFTATEQGHGARLYVRDTVDGEARAISSEGINPQVIVPSPNGNEVAAVASDEKAYIYPLSGGNPRTVAGFQVGEQPIQWSADGKSLYVYRPGDLPAKVSRLDLTTGQRTIWKQLMPLDPAGVSQIGPVVVTSTANAYVYGYHRTLSDLYLVEGLR
jgi:DNA-binding beta-propeller fold protein YncE